MPTIFLIELTRAVLTHFCAIGVEALLSKVVPELPFFVSVGISFAVGVIAVETAFGLARSRKP